MVTLAFWISLTRISNYFHHPYDIVTGAVVGITFALITLVVIADLFNKRSSFWKTFDRQCSSESQGGEGLTLQRTGL